MTGDQLTRRMEFGGGMGRFSSETLNVIFIK